MMKNRMRALACIWMAVMLLTAAVARMLPARAEGTAAPEGNGRTLRILMTSDIHGKFYPYNYVRDTEDSTGSLAQIATAIGEYRTEDTLLVDCGDCVQGNATEFFLRNGEIHPVMAGLNRLGYDIWVTGNHEYDFGMNTLRGIIGDFRGKTLTGNVLDENGRPLADGYTILDKNGVRVAVIGMVTPYIQFWDEANLKGWQVLDPVEESRKIIDSIQGQYDVLIGAMHMGTDEDYDYVNSGVGDLAEACPEFDVILASHKHTLVEGEWMNGVLVTENRNAGKTMSVIDLALEPEGDGWRVAGTESKAVTIGEYEPDPAFMEAFRAEHEQALEKAHREVAVFIGDSLVPESEVKAIPAALLQDSPLIHLMHTVLKYYSGADVCCSALTSLESDLDRGPICSCEISNLYIYSNTVYTLQMTGKQLKKYMEWDAGWYNRLMPGDLTVSFNSDMSLNMYHMFDGINYEIDISREVGSRIINLTWPDGRPVEDEDTFVMATDNYCATTQLLNAGIVFSEEELPKVLERDVHSEIGGIAELMQDYIVNECRGVLKPSCDYNWRIVGISWNEALHARAVELLREGKLSVPLAYGTEGVAVDSIRESDLP